MTDARRTSRLRRRALVGALLLQGLSGAFGGLALLLDPSGAAIGIPLEWLEGSPLMDYFIPGFALFTALGVVPLIVAHRLWQGRPRSSLAALSVGIALLVWLRVQIAVVGYQAEPPLQLVYGVLGAVIVALAVRPTLRGEP
jgi:peptidoglycan/LPS O-acetylase OafA/YrhL